MQRLIPIALAALLFGAAGAHASDPPRHGWSHGQEHHREGRHDRDRYDRDRHDRGHREHYGHHDRGWHGHHHWVRGERLHAHYRGPVYVVRDYRARHLRRPPRGYHWVRDDDDNFLLVAIATGIIADVLINSQ